MGSNDTIPLKAARNMKDTAFSTISPEQTQ